MFEEQLIEKIDDRWDDRSDWPLHCAKFVVLALDSIADQMSQPSLTFLYRIKNALSEKKEGDMEEELFSIRMQMCSLIDNPPSKSEERILDCLWPCTFLKFDGDWPSPYYALASLCRSLQDAGVRDEAIKSSLYIVFFPDKKFH